MFFDRFKKKKETIVTQPVEGKLLALSEVADPVFSQGVMGIGFAVQPSNGKILSPVNGVVESVFPTKHAITLKSETGIDVLVHIGIDTVELNGEGIQPRVSVGEKVTNRTQIAEVDLEKLAKADKASDIIIVFPSLNQELIKQFDLSGTAATVAIL
ncbi:PTS sugar transporter subunit IIA [Candidatus Enterococcus murrayae]|uniref:PTS glucose transporter subunit IIA n=1 Tax=Candidatus Enterococcus murrayae TaxID=2815321 RepID=A0ABS3HJ97_9ENTE|nr:PTS glucose transporter subunit IIA [Enterococcus sp. MJM16]MBO0452628.1 PTS glucose transporter subunit IIA [Enterococcus sp. MJM16]